MDVASDPPSDSTSTALSIAYVAEYSRLAGYVHGAQMPSLVPPTVASVYTYPLLAGLPPTEGTVLVRQEFDVFVAAVLEAVVTSSVSSVDHYERRGNKFMVVTIESRTADGELLLRSRVTRLLPGAAAAETRE
jgi:hypothetical protein